MVVPCGNKCARIGPPAGSGAIVIGSRQLVRDGLKLIEPFQHVFDVARQLLGCEPLRGPAQGRADAGQKVDIVDARSELWLLHVSIRTGEGEALVAGAEGSAQGVSSACQGRVKGASRIPSA